MAHIAVYGTAPFASPEDTAPGFIRLVGSAVLSEAPFNIAFHVDVPWDSTVHEMNQAIRDAAITQAIATGHTINHSDTQVVFGAISQL